MAYQQNHNITDQNKDGFIDEKEAPPEWGQRRAPGELQNALSEMLQHTAALRKALVEYDNLIQDIAYGRDAILDRYNLRADEVNILAGAEKTKDTLDGLILATHVAKFVSERGAEATEKVAEATTEGMPKSAGLATDVTAPARGVVKAVAGVVSKVLKAVADNQEVIVEQLEKQQEVADQKAAAQIDTANFK